MANKRSKEEKEVDTEAYWFIRWVQIRRERNLLKKEVEKLQQTLTDIRKNYQPIKNKIHGNTSGNKRNVR